MEVAIYLAMGMSAIGGLALAILLWRQAGKTAAARPLALFVLLAGCWAAGLLIPNALGASLLATAPLSSAVFVHFAMKLSGWPQSPQLLIVIYALRWR